MIFGEELLGASLSLAVLGLVEVGLALISNLLHVVKSSIVIVRTHLKLNGVRWSSVGPKGASSLLSVIFVSSWNTQAVGAIAPQNPLPCLSEVIRLPDDLQSCKEHSSRDSV